MGTLMGRLYGQGTSTRPRLAAKQLEPLPVVDLSHLNKNSASRSLVIEGIGKACRKLGCFQEAKEEFASDDIWKPVRYEASSKDGISKARAFLKHYAHPLSEWVQFWPLEPQGYREKMGQYAIECRRLAFQLMDAILESLGSGQGYLNDKLDEGIQLMAINCYPKSSQPGDMTGLGPHSDYGFLTILLQTSQGLQVMDSDGEAWRAIPQVPEALCVHIGDYLEVLSNGLYKRAVHRAVLNSEKQRISIACIQSLSTDEKVVVAKELVDEQRPKKYKDSSFRDFLNHLSTKVSKEKRLTETLKIDEA